jgi:hypothetical protein
MSKEGGFDATLPPSSLNAGNVIIDYANSAMGPTSNQWQHW